MKDRGKAEVITSVRLLLLEMTDKDPYRALELEEYVFSEFPHPTLMSGKVKARAGEAGRRR
jgi:hypothetical protein